MSDTVDAPEDLRDAIGAAFDEVAQKEGDPAARPEAEAETPDRTRDAQGRFARREEPEAESAPAEESAAAETSEPQAEAAEQPEAMGEPEKPKTEAPAHWTAADREMFAEQTPEAQAFLTRRLGEMEAHLTRTTQGIAAFRRDFEPVARMLEPHRDALAQKGFTPATLIQSWYAVEKELAEGRGPAIIGKLVKNYGMDMRAVLHEMGVQIGAPAEGGEGQDTPPAPSLPPEIMRQISGALSEINDFKAQQRLQQQAQQAHAASRVMSEIERFKSETGGDGKLLRPHFAAVENDMAMMANAIRQNGGDIPPLPELYESAVWANPSTRAALIADQSAAHEAQRKADEVRRAEEARAKAAKAQRASSVVVKAPAPGHAESRPAPQTLRDTIMEAFAEVNDRA